jgi:hypothetical protein
MRSFPRCRPSHPTPVEKAPGLVDLAAAAPGVTSWNRAFGHPLEGERRIAMDDQKPIRPSREDETIARPSDAQDHAISQEENLEEGLRDSMDASDPPAATQPGDHGNPVPSSGFHEEDEEDSGDTAE